LTAVAIAPKVGGMPRTVRLVGLALVVFGLAIAGAVAVALVWGDGRTSATEAGPAPSIAHLRSFADFALFYAGGTVEGRRFVAVDVRAGVVDFIYGTCRSSGDEGGCPVPIAVQVWDVCSRNPSFYDPTDPYAEHPRHETIRGVPAALYDDRIELQTADATVVVFALGGRPEARAVVEALRGVNNGVRAGDPLPAPVAGALTGELNC
jgi:hypothetical protein